MKRKKSTFFAVLLTAGILFLGAIQPSYAKQPMDASAPFDAEKAIQSGDHKGLAEYYRSQAAEQRRIAEMHQKMKTEYRNTHVHYKGYENVMAGHCGNLQLKAQEMAEQYDKLAEQEEKLIKKK